MTRPLVFCALVLAGALSFLGTAVPASRPMVTSRLKASSRIEKVLYAFAGSDGSYPEAGLVMDASGNLFGTTSDGGHGPACVSYECGTIFELTPNSSGGWTHTLLHTFGSGHDAIIPQSTPILDGRGNVIGTATDGGLGESGVVWEIIQTSSAWTYRIIHTFHGSDGVGPIASPIMVGSGLMYGTTIGGGPGGSIVDHLPRECNGVVYELALQDNGRWRYKRLHAFSIATIPDPRGNTPGGLVLDSNGDLIGMDELGGVDNAYCTNMGCGLIFELNPGTRQTRVLHRFNGKRGAFPFYPMISDGAGGYYAVTGGGGLKAAGLLLQMIPTDDGTWHEKILHEFMQNSPEGSGPNGALVADAAGNLYGETTGGGDIAPCATTGGCGVVYEMVKQRNGHFRYRVLHTFARGVDGAKPYGALIFDGSGNLYGTTDVGGIHDEGTVYEVTP